jgi:glucose uptake protein GlcU
MGYMFAFFSVFFFGTNFVPVKKYDCGDGMFFQLILCCGIWTVGLIVNIVRHSHGNIPSFEPFAMWGGVLWATGNVLTVPIISTIGLGMGMLIWGATNMLIGWATGSFGLFGLTKDTGINHSLNYAGVFCVLCSLTLFMGVKADTGGAAEPGDEDDPSEDKLTRLLQDNDDGDDGNDGNDGNEGGATTGSWVDKLTAAQRRSVGIPMACVAGLLFGSCFNPPTYIIDHAGDKYGPNTPGQGPLGASTAGLDYVFSQFCGIFVTSIFWMMVYCCHMKNKPQVNPEVILPGFISGIMWAIAQFSWFVANECLSFSVAFPLITGGPGLLGAMIGIYLGEIRGMRNYQFLGVSFVFLFIADGLIAASHPS